MPRAKQTEIAKVLIVDDRQENLIATRRILSEVHADLVLANSGNEALKRMLHERFAAILLDVQMPEMDGFETASLMRHHEKMKDTPIIFITAISKDAMYVDQAAELGAVDYVFKPVNPNILISKVNVFVELHQQRVALTQYIGQLAEKNDELERFAYACSHDLKEPLRSISMLGALIQRRCAEQLDEKGQVLLQRMVDAGVRAQQMVEDILAFSRIGREPLVFEQIEVEPLLASVLENLHERIESTSATISSEIPPAVIAPKTLLSILLQNLTSNALKFMPEGRQPEVAITLSEEGEVYRLSVRDNGIGMEKGDETAVFAAFRRLHRRDEYEGTGIGLSTCKKLLELVGGRIWYESTPGEGTNLLCEWPVRKAGAQV